MTFGRLSPNDPSSFSRPDLVKVSHLEIHWFLNFDENFIDGHVKLTVEKIDTNINELLLDSNGLEISSMVLQCEDGTEEELTYYFGEYIPEIGEKITIDLPEGCPDNFCVKIDYCTSRKALGFQWLSPDQTGTKTKPLLFSQFESIHARSAVPCQDTPFLKATYTADVATSLDVEVVMSALRKDKVTLSDGSLLFKYSQPVPIPAYLIAIAAGALEERKVGPRSSVWAEKNVVERAAYEFAEVEDMIVAAESLCGPYVWGVYDMLVLPPSFPYGGMENPNLTFITPTILAGDRSLVDVVVHEITHSWTGNLVTNCNWEHFWLNEGFTMFIERKIVGILHGAKERHLDAACGWKALAQCVKTVGDDSPSTILVPDLTGVDPESNYTVVPYEKGHAFLWYLESLLGEDGINKFLRHYIDRFAPRAIDSYQFKECLYDFFASKKEILDSIDWDTWWYKPGMPPVELKFDTSLIECCTNLLQKWLAWGVNSECTFSKEDLKQFSSNQTILWLTMMAEEDAQPIEKLKKMDAIYDLSSSKNSEIIFYWTKVCLKARWEKVVQPAIDFINEQGRMKYVVPIYREMYQWTEVRPTAIANFHKNKKFMMHCAVHKLMKELHLS